MNILLLASHAVAEYDDVRMFADLGYDIFAPGGYAVPSDPGETLRPAVDAPDHPELRALCEVQRAKHAGKGDAWAIDWAKADVHPDILDWADVVIVHHFPERWIPQLLGKAKRVIWRTCGQSNPQLEHVMSFYRGRGLEIIRYSPAEQRYFEAAHSFAGQDAIIRFGKYPDDYGPWTGEWNVVGNLSQWQGSDDPLGRADALHLDFWLEATEGLPTMPAGPGSEALPNGLGRITYPTMLDYLCKVRTYLYTGTEPASYTLNLIEAMLSGAPVVAMPRGLFRPDPDLYEADEIVNPWHPQSSYGRAVNDPIRLLRVLMNEPPNRTYSDAMRERAVSLFGIETIGAKWRTYLGSLKAER